jgi:lipoate-protein ligase A
MWRYRTGASPQLAIPTRSAETAFRLPSGPAFVTLSEGAWRLITEEARGGALNMALDEVAAETAAEGGPRTLRVYRWEPGTLSLGYHQPADTVDWDYCEREGVPVVRRPTGGGGIYHDTHGDISYSIVVPAGDVPGDLMASYELLLDPVLDALDRMGVPAAVAEERADAIHEPSCYLRAVHPAHDVVVDGRKISGTAQHRTRDAVVQHGSITFARATERHLGCFTDAPDPATFDERVTSVREHADIDRGEAVATLESALAEWADADVGSWSADELDRAEVIASEQFGSEAWTRRH